MAGEPSGALAAAIGRYEALLHELADHLRSEQERASHDADLAAEHYLAILRNMHKTLADDLADSREPSAIPVADQLEDLESVAQGLGLLIHALGDVGERIAPRVNPLVATFERVLDALFPAHAAVFQEIAEVNYELASIQFDELGNYLHGDNPIKALHWPVMFIRVPSAPLDSPRNHALVGHEIGHAVAAVAAHYGDYDAAALPERLQNMDISVVLPSEAAARVARVHTEELGVLLDEDQEPEEHVIAEQAEKLSEVANSWAEEFFGDAVGAALFGPAFMLAFLDVFPPTRPLARGSSTHPPDALRLKLIRRILDDNRCGPFQDLLPEPIRSRLDETLELAEAAAGDAPGQQDTLAEEETLKEVYDAVAEAMERIAESALGVCDGLCYTRAQFSADVDRHLASLAKHGVPPLARPGEAPPSLATILNVAAVVGGELAAIPDVETRWAACRGLDNAVTRAIELAEIGRVWAKAAEQ